MMMIMIVMIMIVMMMMLINIHTIIFNSKQALIAIDNACEIWHVMSNTYHYYGPGAGVAHSHREIDVMIALRERIVMMMKITDIEGNTMEINIDTNDSVLSIDNRSSRDSCDNSTDTDDMHSDRDDQHIGRDNKHIGRDDQHIGRDNMHSDRDDKHIGRDDKNIGRDDKHIGRDDQHIGRDDAHRVDIHQSATYFTNSNLQEKGKKIRRKLIKLKRRQPSA